MQEIWKGVIYQGKDYSEFYEVSNKGKLRNAKTKREVKLNPIKTGHLSYCGSLGARGKNKLFKLHRCIAEAFIPRIKHKNQINHKDGNKLNNAIENLEWCTNQENSQHAFDMGLIIPKRGIFSSCSRLTKENVSFVRENYIPKDRNFGARALGRKFNVSHQTILKIINFNTYKED